MLGRLPAGLRRSEISGKCPIYGRCAVQSPADGDVRRQEPVAWQGRSRTSRVLDPQQVVGSVEPERVATVAVHAEAEAVASRLTQLLPQIVGGLELVPKLAGPVLPDSGTGR